MFWSPCLCYERKSDLHHDSHHAEPNINILLTRNLYFDSNVTSDSEVILYWYHCSICGLNRTIDRVTWFCFCFSEASAKWSEFKGINELILKRKPTWWNDMITYNRYPWIMFSFNWLVIFWWGRGVIRNWTPKVKGMEVFWT